MLLSPLRCKTLPKRIAKIESLCPSTDRHSLTTTYSRLIRQTASSLPFSTYQPKCKNPFEFLTSLLGLGRKRQADSQQRETTKDEQAVVGRPSPNRVEKSKDVAQSVIGLLQERDILQDQQTRSRVDPQAPASTAHPPSRKARHKWKKTPGRSRYAKRKVRDTEVSRVFRSPRLTGFSQSRRPYIIFEPLQRDPGIRAESIGSDSEDLEYIKMLSYVQILTTPTADTPGTTLLLHFDTKRYLIGNVSEGTQRAVAECGTKLVKVSEIFITGRTESANIGGLIGLILTLADGNTAAARDAWENQQEKAQRRKSKDGYANGKSMTNGEKAASSCSDKPGESRLTLFGPPNLTHALAAARHFVFRKGMPLDVTEVKGEKCPEAEDGTWPPTWSDENIKVWAMSITPSMTSVDATTDVNAGLRPQNTKKRSYADYDMPQAVTDESIETAAERSDRYDQMRRAVVSDMFDSSWHLDALVEMPLSEVKLPASLWFRNPESKQIEKYDGPMPGSPDFRELKVLLRKPWPGALVDNLPPTKPAKEAISYIIRNHPQRGRFKPNVAKQLEVEQGLKWSQLAKGQSVQNKYGRTIHPDMVLEEGKQGGGLAVVDLPSTDYVQPLIDRAEWQSPYVMDGVGAIVWILGSGVASDLRLAKFISELPHIKHVISSKDCCPNILALKSAAGATARLAQIDPKRFRIPVHENENDKASGYLDLLPSSLTEELHSMTVTAKRGHIIQLTPTVDLLDHEVEPLLDVNSVLSQTSADVLALAGSARQAVEEDRTSLEAWSRRIPSNDAGIITLGTGSALPSKYRNVSATLLRIPGYGSYLFDCGENTLGQLKRVFNNQEFKAVLRDLKMIWISHMHADHHLGTVPLIRAWHEENYGVETMSNTSNPVNDVNLNPHQLLRSKRRLALISEPSMLHHLREFASVENFGYHRIAPLHISPAEPLNSIPSYLQWFGSFSPFARLDHSRYSESNLGFSDIQAVNVDHCYGARAVSITFPNGFRVSYSGDCRPSKNFARIGENSSVLIHEATFDDELAGDAEAKKHSTTSEALEIAREMNAKAVVLTHFSQRYQKIPIIEAWDEDGRTTCRADEEMAEGHVEHTGNETAKEPPVAQYAIDTPNETAIRMSNNSGRDMKVCVAFDYMQVKVGEIAQLEKFRPALLKLFEPREDDSNAGDVRQQAGKQKKKKTQRRN